MAGIALPLLGIVASVVVSVGRDGTPPASPASADGRQAPVSEPSTASPTPSQTLSPSPSPSRSTTGPSPSPGKSTAQTAEVSLTPPAGYGAARTGTWGVVPGDCVQQENQLVDLDTGESRVEREYGGRVKDPGGAELFYWPESCSFSDRYRLRGMPNTRVGILRADAPHTAEACKAAANTGLATLNLADAKATKDRGFVIGAAICSVTTEGAIAMASIDHMSGDSMTEVSANGNLYVWPKSP
ncbi:hypothetical protein AB0D54_37065 [Streptomyces xanthophaeus]|uniref:hypothetical protein n=1 Tax=Streptomyces xanthophaeus TaxID=67385 RepID=UPI003435E1AB